jgi:hypothetical protein
MNSCRVFIPSADTIVTKLSAKYYLLRLSYIKVLKQYLQVYLYLLIPAYRLLLQHVSQS